MFLNREYQDIYNETNDIVATNKKVNLSKNDIINEQFPYKEYSKIQLRVFDSPGRYDPLNLNKKFLIGMNALIILFDITNENSFKKIINFIEKAKIIYEEIKAKNFSLDDDNIKQPNSFNEIPIIIVGNKSDMENERKIKKEEIEQYNEDIILKEKFTCLKYHEISVKDNKGIDGVFDDIFKYYFNRKIDSIYQAKKDENKNNNINDLSLNEDNNKIKKPSLDKSIFVYHQMLDKMKKEIYLDMSSVKQENKNENDKNKALEEKLNKLTNQLINENQLLKDKLNIIENKNSVLEQQIKLKDKEIQELKQKVNDIIISTKAINLKFKLSNDNAKDEISIRAKGESKISEVLSTLYDIYPYIKNYNVKGLYLEGNESEKIDEMKTVNGNNLVDGSLIVLIV
jgi:GTPase SAR1 family protein